MLELVIDDDLDSPLTCPTCHGIFVRCLLRMSCGEAACKYCGAKFNPTRAGGSSSPPAGVSVSDRGADWSIDISTRSLRAALVCVASGVGVFGILGDVDHLWSISGSHLWSPSLLGVITAVALFAAAAYWFWGRNSISVSGSDGTVFRGIGRFGKRQAFFLPGINGVRLTQSVDEDWRGNQVMHHIIRLEGLGFYMDFGADLTEQQRTYIALFLLQRIAAWSTINI